MHEGSCLTRVPTPGEGSPLRPSEEGDPSQPADRARSEISFNPEEISFDHKDIPIFT